ncbi:MAG: alpha-E domain-containing protein [Gammaproteobacteria bacterium]
MLSRVAQRIYWLGRYVERAESTARLVQVMATLLLDLPRDVRLGWRTLIDITGSGPAFDEAGAEPDERTVVRFMLWDQSNPGSVLSSLNAARENARTTREILPTEAWERINTGFLALRDSAGGAASYSQRHPILQRIIAECQGFTGMLSGGMSHEAPATFVRLGRYLERADMATRILDVGSARLLTREDTELTREQQGAYTNVLWMSVLRSLSALQMYRQHVHDRVNAEDVIAFLLQDMKFPRAVAHCLGQIGVCLAQLPRHDGAGASLAAVSQLATGADVSALVRHGLHEFIDDLQLGFAAIHDRIADTWFLPQGA